MKAILKWADEKHQDKDIEINNLEDLLKILDEVNEEDYQDNLKRGIKIRENIDIMIRRITETPSILKIIVHNDYVE
jgi:hypothetical protein